MVGARANGIVDGFDFANVHQVLQGGQFKVRDRLLVLLVLVCAMTLAKASQADEEYVRTGTYLQAGAGWTIDGGVVEDGVMGLQAALGYRATQRLAIEVGAEGRDLREIRTPPRQAAPKPSKNRPNLAIASVSALPNSMQANPVNIAITTNKRRTLNLSTNKPTGICMAIYGI